jgi:hypothetical protein
LTSALEGGKWSASLPGRFTPEEKAPVPVAFLAWLGGIQSCSGRGGEETNSEEEAGRKMFIFNFQFHKIQGNVY